MWLGCPPKREHPHVRVIDVIVGRVGRELHLSHSVAESHFPFESYLDVALWFCRDMEPQKVKTQLWPHRAIFL